MGITVDARLAAWMGAQHPYGCGCSTTTMKGGSARLAAHCVQWPLDERVETEKRLDRGMSMRQCACRIDARPVNAAQGRPYGAAAVKISSAKSIDPSPLWRTLNNSRFAEPTGPGAGHSCRLGRCVEPLPKRKGGAQMVLRASSTQPVRVRHFACLGSGATENVDCRCYRIGWLPMIGYCCGIGFQQQECGGARVWCGGDRLAAAGG